MTLAIDRRSEQYGVNVYLMIDLAIGLAAALVLAVLILRFVERQMPWLRRTVTRVLFDNSREATERIGEIIHGHSKTANAAKQHHLAGWNERSDSRRPEGRSGQRDQERPQGRGKDKRAERRSAQRSRP